MTRPRKRKAARAWIACGVLLAGCGSTPLPNETNAPFGGYYGGQPAPTTPALERCRVKVATEMDVRLALTERGWVPVDWTPEKDREYQQRVAECAR